MTATSTVRDALVPANQKTWRPSSGWISARWSTRSGSSSPARLTACMPRATSGGRSSSASTGGGVGRETFGSAAAGALCARGSALWLGCCEQAARGSSKNMATAATLICGPITHPGPQRTRCEDSSRGPSGASSRLAAGYHGSSSTRTPGIHGRPSGVRGCS